MSVFEAQAALPFFGHPIFLLLIFIAFAIMFAQICYLAHQREDAEKKADALEIQAELDRLTITGLEKSLQAAVDAEIKQNTAEVRQNFYQEYLKAQEREKEMYVFLLTNYPEQLEQAQLRNQSCLSLAQELLLKKKEKVN